MLILILILMLLLILIQILILVLMLMLILILIPMLMLMLIFHSIIINTTVIVIQSAQALNTRQALSPKPLTIDRGGAPIEMVLSQLLASVLSQVGAFKTFGGFYMKVRSCL